MSVLVEYTAPMWRGLDMRALKVDQAYFVLQSFYDQMTYLYTCSDECYTCPYSKVKSLQSQRVSDGNDENQHKLHALPLNVAHALQLKIYDDDLGRYAFDNETALCEFYEYNLQEFGVYNLTVFANGTCTLVTDKEGVNVNLSILSVFMLIAMILSVMKLSWCAWSTYRFYEVETTTTSATVTPDNAGTVPKTSSAIVTRKRMQSLDTFRGLAIVLMIFVNSGGGDYWWIDHATWNGLHLADIVFPSFLWIMGVCIPISIKSQLGRGTSKIVVCRRIIWRAVKLFAIGLCLNSINGPQMEQLRIMGVLQRFGIAFLVCGIVHTIFAKREIIEPQILWKRTLHDLILLKGEFVIILLLIITHTAIIFGISVPNCPRGYLGPGGKHSYAAYPNCIGGATGYIDLQILGTSHIYQHPTAKYIYDSKAFDPEGLLGCLLTIVQVLLGLVAGVIILVHTNWKARLIRWLSWSFILGLIGGILCAFSKEAGAIPINKNLWSLSFVFVTSSIAFAILSILYFVIDVRKWWHGTPFVESGKNAIIMYVGHTVMHKMLPWHWRIGAMNTHFILLLEATWNTLMWIVIALYLDFKKFYYSL